MDFYSVLGVLPDAEDVVIRAAYRALAQRYHPDKWSGDKDEAHRKMLAINEAYRVLGDQNLRAAYDRSRSNASEEKIFDQDQQEQSEAFNSALGEAEKNWEIACGVYPDLREHRDRLRRISSSLAFSYVTLLLETKRFGKREEIANHMESVFLERYFGKNEKILNFARMLILSGYRDAAKALNTIISVVGSEVESEPIIKKISTDFKLHEKSEDMLQKKLRDGEFRKVQQKVKDYCRLEDAEVLAELMGCSVEVLTEGFLTPRRVKVVTHSGKPLLFETKDRFVKWVLDNYC